MRGNVLLVELEQYGDKRDSMASSPLPPPPPTRVSESPFQARSENLANNNVLFASEDIRERDDYVPPSKPSNFLRTTFDHTWIDLANEKCRETGTLEEVGLEESCDIRA